MKKLLTYQEQFVKSVSTVKREARMLVSGARRSGQTHANLSAVAAYALTHPGSQFHTPLGYRSAQEVAGLFRRHGFAARAYGNQVRGTVDGILPWSFIVV